MTWSEWIASPLQQRIQEIFFTGEMVWTCCAVALVLLSLLCGARLAGIKFRRGAEHTVWRVTQGVLLGAILFAFAVLVWGFAAALGGRPSAWGITLGLLGAAAAVLCATGKSLITPQLGGVPSADSAQQRKLATTLTVLFVLETGFLLWLIFLYGLLRSCPAGLQGCLLAFTALGLCGLGYLIRVSISGVFERMEALIDKQYQAELLNYMQIIRAQRHDFNIHLQAVTGLIEQGKYEECRAYAATMAGTASRLNDLLPIHNLAISAMINTFAEIAARDQIRLQVEVLDPLDDLPCTVYEINTVIGNLLQNALDEVRTHEPDLRFIKLLIMKRSHSHIIKVSNPCDKDPAELQQMFQPGYTTKRSHEGIGLATVRRVVTRCGGTVYLETEPGVLHFIAKLPVAAKKDSPRDR